jgi:ATP synthase I chain
VTSDPANDLSASEPEGTPGNLPSSSSSPVAQTSHNNEAEHARFSRRVQYLTVILGLIAALAVALLKSRPAGYGIALGSLLAWLNFRWLEQGLSSFVRGSAAQEGLPKPQVPISTYAKFGGRYALIGLALYGIVTFLAVPALWIIVGLMALGLAVTVEGLYEVYERISAGSR